MNLEAVDWGAVGNVAVGAGTGALALVTGWLAWSTRTLARHTDRMASETNRMAAATEGLLAVDEDRRRSESTANVVPLHWNGGHQGDLGLVVMNAGGAAALDVVAEWWMRQGWHRTQPLATLIDRERHGFGRDVGQSAAPSDPPAADLWNEATSAQSLIARVHWRNVNGKPASSEWRRIEER